MPNETKIILALLAQLVGNAKTVQEAYGYIVRAANVEGLQLPSYEDWRKEVDEIKSRVK